MKLFGLRGLLVLFMFYVVCVCVCVCKWYVCVGYEEGGWRPITSKTLNREKYRMGYPLGFKDWPTGPRKGHKNEIKFFV